MLCRPRPCATSRWRSRAALEARAALDAQAEARAVAARARRRDRPGARARSPTRSVVPSRTTARTCGTTPRRSSAGCASELRERAASASPRSCAALARRSELREHLQEDFVTQRGGRPVLAVKASARRSVPGIVHDASSSGQTLFVEPFEIVELEQRPVRGGGAEREEVERILRELSACASASAPRRVRALVEATGAIDLALAGGTLSRGWRGAPVESLGRGAAARRAPSAARPGARRSRSTSTSARCARSSSAGRTPAARRSR